MFCSGKEFISSVIPLLVFNPDINALMNLPISLCVIWKMTSTVFTFVFFLLQFTGDSAPKSAED